MTGATVAAFVVAELQRRTGVQDDPDYAEDVRCSTAVLMADMATVFRAFGRCASGRVDGTAEEEHAALGLAADLLRLEPPVLTLTQEQNRLRRDKPLRVRRP
jgi:hypothetical protein